MHKEDHRVSTLLSVMQMLLLLLGAFMVNNSSMWLAGTYGHTKAFTIAQSLSIGSGFVSLANAITFVSRFEKHKQYPTALRFKVGFIFSLLLLTAAFVSTSMGFIQVLPTYDIWIGMICMTCVFVSIMLGILEGFL